jgi:hypothetical protein
MTPLARNKGQPVLPNFLICGAPKAGTSSLHTWIADHPDALGSTEKETYFCVDSGTHMFRPAANIADGLEGYSRYFAIKPGQNPKVILESTPSYLYQQTALRQVPDLPTKPKCLFVLREPGQQIYSLFTYFQNNWSWIPAGMRFGDYLSTLRKGNPDMFRGNELARDALRNARYADFLELWRARLGDERMMVCSFDQLKADPQALTRRIAAWLGLDPSFYDQYAFPRDNETYVVRNSALQRANVALRGWLPRGALYRSLRSLYRQLNTRPPEGPDEADQALIAALSADFAEANARLRARFGLELPGWA